MYIYNLYQAFKAQKINFIIDQIHKMQVNVKMYISCIFKIACQINFVSF